MIFDRKGSAPSYFFALANRAFSPDGVGNLYVT
jgi:hypothetical protein